MMRMVATAAFGLVAACAGGVPEAGPSPVAAQRTDTTNLVPPGYGTLRQEEVTLSIRSGALLVKVTPLAEFVTRLLAPDTYERLHALSTSLLEPGQERSLFLVSFFSYEPDVTFTPEDLQLVHQGRIMRAILVRPVTSGFGRQRLQQQETQSAVYVFDEPINYELPITVRYGLNEAGDWLPILQRLERERSRVRARTGRG